jgi:RNA polymerase sigma-70 factor (ECF subfamily)
LSRSWALRSPPTPLRATPRSAPADGGAITGDDDAALVLRARRGDSSAYALLFERHAPALARLLGCLTGSRADAEDALQETFVIAFERFGQLRQADALRSWLAQIAVSQARRLFRRRKLWRLFGREGTRDLALDCLASPTAPPEACAELALVAQALDAVPMRERVAWVLRFVEDYQLDEVADACDCSLATAKRRIVAAQAVVEAHLGRGLVAEEAS